MPLPGHLGTTANIAKKVGGEKWANELISEMNSAASSAVIGASVVFANAIKNMNEADVKQIINGGKDSFTSFLKKNSSTELERVFKPIIDEKMSKSSFATAYNSLSNLIPSNSENIKSIQNLVANFDKNGYMLKENEDLNSYITRKTLDGLFNVMSEKEDTLRGNSVLNKLIK
ncbi:MAG: DUF4197 domain-containing protein [Wolinella sp.]